MKSSMFLNVLILESLLVFDLSESFDSFLWWPLSFLEAFLMRPKGSYWIGCSSEQCLDCRCELLFLAAVSVWMKCESYEGICADSLGLDLDLFLTDTFLIIINIHCQLLDDNNHYL